MKKLNNTYIMGVCCLIIAGAVGIAAARVPELLVSNEPGPRLFPYISAAGIGVFAVLSMIFDGPRDTGREYLDKAGFIRLIVIMGECFGFAVCMQLTGFLITSIVGLFIFIWTLKGDKQINIPFAVVLCVILGSICYFGFTRGFLIPLPRGIIFEKLGIMI